MSIIKKISNLQATKNSEGIQAGDSSVGTRGFAPQIASVSASTSTPKQISNLQATKVVRFTYAKYIEACLNEDYETLAKNYERVDGFHFVWEQKWDHCVKIICSGRQFFGKYELDLFTDEQSKQDLITKIEETISKFSSWLAFNSYEDFVAYPKENKKQLYEKFKLDIKNGLTAIGHLGLYEYCEKKIKDGSDLTDVCKRFCEYYEQ